MDRTEQIPHCLSLTIDPNNNIIHLVACILDIDAVPQLISKDVFPAYFLPEMVNCTTRDVFSVKEPT